MLNPLTDILRFYFITDHAAPGRSVIDQVKAALSGGATMVQYRNKIFSPDFYQEAVAVRDLCKSNRIPFIINDDIVLAKAVHADGVHLGQSDQPPLSARKILGPDAIIGVSVSTLAELENTDLTGCDYIGAGPVYRTDTKPDAKPVIGLAGLKAVIVASPIPVVAIGGIDAANADGCFSSGAAGVAVISAVSRANDPLEAAKSLAAVCETSVRTSLKPPWSDEFALIDKLIHRISRTRNAPSRMIIPPGDDTALLRSLSRPVITTDTQREGVHFHFSWQTPEEIGEKAVEITFSDLAAAYAEPVCLFVNLGLPSYVSDETVEAIYTGIGNSLSKQGCEMGGGNISGADQVSLDLFAVGEGRNDIMPLRSNARAGYGLYATGPLGLSRAGLELLKQKNPDYPGLVRKFKSPRARFDAAGVLAENGVYCLMDISDGLAGDARHMARASGISIFLEIDPQLLHPDLITFCNSDMKKAMEAALAGGEDYELLFACPPEHFEKIRKQLPEAYPVGRCLDYTGAAIINPPDAFSFQHGKQ